jgi:hypothetical protein
MGDIKTIDYKQERENDSNKVLESPYPRKVIVGGPGTGKSYLFQAIIKKKKAEGKRSFLAITFVGKLGDELADDLAGLAETMTLHGFARRFILENCPKGWKYYPKMKDIVEGDLGLKGITKYSIGDKYYEERTKYYKAVGEEDVVYYAVQICKRDNGKIPKRDLILIDEYQDFNEIEDQFIGLLALKNEIIVVGDDDQALYGWKGASPKFIRDKYVELNDYFESHTLRFCSRCTEVIINAFHRIVDHYRSKSKLADRIKKEYICYVPEKKNDSDLNQKILVFENTNPGYIPTKIKNTLASILREQKIKSVLVIGEARSCRPLLIFTANKFKEFGFRNVDYGGEQGAIFSFKPHVVEGYKILSEGDNDIFAWRLLIEELGDGEKKKIVSRYYSDSAAFIRALPSGFQEAQRKNARTLERILDEPESTRKQIASSSIEELATQVVTGEKERREVFIGQLLEENKTLPRPLKNLDITVCSILGAKGLGADVVFLLGFDQGKLPSKEDAEDSEIYQMLVALTRAKKRIYLVNTTGSKISQFIDCIDQKYIEKV